MVENKNYKIVFIVSLAILSFIYFLDRYITKTEKVLYERLESSVIKDMSSTAKNIDDLLKNETQMRKNKSLFAYMKDEVKKREEFEEKLSLFIASKIKYLYLIYKDDNQRFRFLLDGSTEDKARFNQKLDIGNDAYYAIYNSKKEFAIKQYTLEKLSITFLYPIIEKDEVEAILVFDFSSAFEHELKGIVSPLKTMFLLIYIIVSIFLFVTIIQTLLYYQARKRSYIDALTGACNRQYLRYFLDINDIDKYKVMMIDFDFFKKVNDNYGHSVGDGVLVFGTQLIQSCLENNDYLFRYGGEEFLVLVNKNKDIETIAQQIRATIDKTHYIDKKINIKITVSIGVNPIPGHARNASQAISIADSMLYKAKSQGRNCVVTYSEMMQVNVEEKQSDSRNIHYIVEALDEDRVFCHFHKIIDSKNEIYKYEALVRYITKEGEIIYPNHFLDDITHTKVYTDLTKRVIDICINEIKTKRVCISLNLNVNDLLDAQLMDYIVYKIDAIKDLEKTLTIEILEHEEIQNIEELAKVIKKLHAYGIRFAIDDFGSGYANFDYLIDLELDYIKIDGSLVQKIVTSQKSKNIVKCIIDLAHDMGIKTIVEFVSSKEIQEGVISLGTDYMQGFYISKPQAKI